jgi:hypothetical protein
MHELPMRFWGYNNAYEVYDLLRHEYAHNGTAKEILDGYKDVASNVSYLDTLRWLADQQQYTELGNLSAYNHETKLTGYRSNEGSISTVAGNFLAYRIVGLLSDAIQTGGSVNKLNLLFSEFQPFMSFFALAGLPDQSSNFRGIPNFGASMVFEVFSFPNTTNSTLPNYDDLRVRFLFRNGTDENERFLSYPLFNRPKEQTDMYWSDFALEMDQIAINSLPDWCTVCGADFDNSFICAAIDSHYDDDDGNRRYGGRRQRSGTSPVVSGIIGAIVALAIAGVIFGAAMLLCGVRFHRNRKSGSRKGSDLGGFKGGQKMASDQDLTIPKGGAIVGASVVASPGHERVGSWELKQPGLGPRFDESVRPSMEERRDPFADSMRPVVPHERV